jgi:hypothetical protein
VIACKECGGPIPRHDDGLDAIRSTCSDACAERACSRPGWIAVADLSPVQRAELDGILSAAAGRTPS